MRPGVLLLKASLRRLQIKFIADDLPALERPAMAISPGPSAGSSAVFDALVRKLMFWIQSFRGGINPGADAVISALDSTKIRQLNVIVAGSDYALQV